MWPRPGEKELEKVELGGAGRGGVLSMHLFGQFIALPIMHQFLWRLGMSWMDGPRDAVGWRIQQQ